MVAYSGLENREDQQPRLDLHCDGKSVRLLVRRSLRLRNSVFWISAYLVWFGSDLKFDILERPLPLAMGKPNELAPPVRKLAPDARRMWVGFTDTVERQTGPDGPLASVRGLANKLSEHAARIAAVLSVVTDIDGTEVSSEQMAAGTTLAQHYLGEAPRLFEASQVGKDLLVAQRLLAWLLQPVRRAIQSYDLASAKS